MSQGPYTSRGIDRLDARLKVTGKAVYSAEVNVANLAHAVLVGSTTASAKLAAIDVERARRAAGVLAVITHANAPRLQGARSAGNKTPTDRVLQVLQDDAVVYDDQPVAMVVAETLERARYAASLVTVTYKERVAPTVTFDQRSETYAPKRANRESTDSNRGDVDAARAGAAAKIDATYTIPIENHNPMEMHATIAVWRGADALTLYDSTQGIFGVRKKLASVFGLDAKNVRVLSLYVGGGFGCKGTPWSHVVLAAMAARVTGRPVKLVLTRQQMFSLVGHRPRTVQRVQLAADKDGRLVAVQHDALSHTSRFDEFVEPAALTARHLYACSNVRTSHRLVRLDVPTPTFMRAPGEATGSFALESAMDELAYALDMDPLALRLKNYADRDDGEDKPYSSKSLRACYERGAEAFGWAKRPRAIGSLRDGHTRVGWGMATATYPARRLPAQAWASIQPDGTAIVRCGSHDIGTGTYTIMTQVASDALGIPPQKVKFELGDTTMPKAPVSGGSMTAASIGPAVHQACLAARRKLVEMAVGDEVSPLKGAQPEQVVAEEGWLRLRDDPSRREPMAAIIARHGGEPVDASGEARPGEEKKKFSSHSFGAVFVEVQVDPDLGIVRVPRIV
ncbi:MAG TPA: xanthine dehydrogenase family protein molybdopterin-binding subunit, partial [Polyangia bacterium]|nr:xanthine dehydrogenase family protein molybdopterin-binding subunit [Polyangia bacterium]